MTEQHLPDGWDPAPLAAALQMIASDTRIHGRVAFDFGPAGTVVVVLDLDPTKLTCDVTDGLLAQLAQLALLAAH